MKRANFPFRKEQRRAEAQSRQEAYNALTVEQKLQKLGNFAATKQRTRLAGKK